MKKQFLILIVLVGLVIIGCGEDKVNTEQYTEPLVTQASTDMVMHPEYAKSVARIAYIWGYPMVNMMNRRDAIGYAPEPGRMGDVIIS